MSSDLPAVLAVALAAPGLLLWAVLGAALARLRRRGRIPAGAVRVIVVTGAATNVYPTASLVGLDLPRWVLVPCLAVAVAVGFGYLIAQMRKQRIAIHGPWPEHPGTLGQRAERRRYAEHYRAVVARMDHKTSSDSAGVDAPARDETEPR